MEQLRMTIPARFGKFLLFIHCILRNAALFPPIIEGEIQSAEYRFTESPVLPALGCRVETNPSPPIGPF